MARTSTRAQRFRRWAAKQNQAGMAPVEHRCKDAFKTSLREDQVTNLINFTMAQAVANHRSTKTGKAWRRQLDNIEGVLAS